MVHTSEAFYISSDFKNTVIFDYHHDIDPDLINGCYEPLAKVFMRDVARFGTDIEFPPELIAKMDSNSIDRMMLDCEFHPERTFFIVIGESSRYINIIDDKEFVLWGGNNTHLVFEAKKGKAITVLPIVEAKKYFIQTQKAPNHPSCVEKCTHE